MMVLCSWQVVLCSWQPLDVGATYYIFTALITTASPNETCEYSNHLNVQHSAILSTCILNDYRARKPIFVFFEWPLKTGSTVHVHCTYIYSHFLDWMFVMCSESHIVGVSLLVVITCFVTFPLFVEKSQSHYQLTYNLRVQKQCISSSIVIRPIMCTH